VTIFGDRPRASHARVVLERRIGARGLRAHVRVTIRSLT
jgi:hypothetical protein